MFKFRFVNDTSDSDKEYNEKKEKLEWIPASKLHLTSAEIEVKYEADFYMETKMFPGYKIKLIRSDKVLEDLIKQDCQNIIINAESQHSDLIPTKYEGGLKIWECTFDLGQYILKENIELKDKLVMDLGCGAGLIGIIALLRDSKVHFQDYNVEVLKSVTIPNVLLNFDDRINIPKRCEFYAGDWESFATLCAKEHGECRKYDYIFTSETIYNSDNHKKLYDVFKKRLKINGVVFVAGKTYYFGVGGGMRQFENLVLKDECFDIKSVWKSQDGLNREILRLTKKS